MIRITTTWMSIIMKPIKKTNCHKTVSYTHLDVYKRQANVVSNILPSMILALPTYIITLSYLNL